MRNKSNKLLVLGHHTQHLQSFIAVTFILTLCLLADTNSAARTCESLDGEPGKCTRITNCPILLDLLKTDNYSDVRKLQRLTCGFSQNVPKACCPIDEIRQVPQDDIPIFTILSNLNRTKNGSYRFKFKAHKNFDMFPSLENCSQNQAAFRIIGGNTAAFGMYPWLVRVGYKVSSTGSIVYGCSGTLINERYILTAAHCVTSDGIGHSLVPYEVRLSEHNTKINPECYPNTQCVGVHDVKIEKVISHPRYNQANKQNDIALLRLSEKITFSDYKQPICLPFVEEYEIKDFPQVFKGQSFTVAGWGKTKWNKAQGSDVLMDVSLPYIPNQVCHERYSAISSLDISQKQICAGGSTDKDSCDGDSGGPLMFLHHNKEENFEGKLYQVGIVSFGPLHCASGTPGVYSRVTEFLDWILNSVEP